MGDKEYKSLKWILRTVIGALIANIAIILTAVWFMSDINRRVTTLEKDEIEIKESMIDETDWKYNDYFTRYLWAERWGQEKPKPPYSSRGVPNL